MVVIFPKSDPSFQTAVYNSFAQILNKMMDNEVINNQEAVQIIQELKISEKKEESDVEVRKRVYQIYKTFMDIFNTAGVEYTTILDTISENERVIAEKQIGDKEEREKRPYAHLRNAAQRIFGYRDKLELANMFWEIQPFFYDKSKIWWLWDIDDRMWSMVDEIDLFNALDRALLSDLTLRNKHKAETIEALKRVGRGRQPKPIKPTMIQFMDKVYDLDTGDILDATPDLFATNPIPHKIGITDDTPTIDRIFKEWVGEDYVETLHEILAYCLLPDYPLHRIFCLVGSGMNGKGKFLELISRFIGDNNKTSTELDYLIHNRFEAAKLYKKLVCLMGETNFSELNKTSLLKRLSGGDTIGYEFKNKNPFDGYNYAKIIIATNSLPTTTDKTRGFYRRWLLIDFPFEFTEKKDILGEIPPEEYDNLANKCLKLLKRLLNNREFKNEGTIEERMKRYEERSNPIAQFIKDKCVKGHEFNEPLFKFFEDFQIYTRQRGHRTLSRHEVKKLLKNEGYDVDKKRIRFKEEDGTYKDTAWVHVFGLKIFQPDNLSDYQISQDENGKAYKEDLGTFGTMGQKISLNSLHGKLVEKTVPKVPKNMVASGENSKPGYEIHHKCSCCGNEPSHTYDSRGKPICQDCAQSMTTNQIPIQNDLIIEEEVVADDSEV